jgi:hypothetical protein
VGERLHNTVISGLAVVTFVLISAGTLAVSFRRSARYGNGSVPAALLATWFWPIYWLWRLIQFVVATCSMLRGHVQQRHR